MASCDLRVPMEMISWLSLLAWGVFVGGGKVGLGFDMLGGGLGCEEEEVFA